MKEKQEHKLPFMPSDQPSLWYHVPAAKTDPYLVDLCAFEGNASCTCPDWQCRSAPQAAIGKGRPCKHIKAIQTHIKNQMYKNLIAMELEAREKEQEQP